MKRLRNAPSGATTPVSSPAAASSSAAHAPALAGADPPRAAASLLIFSTPDGPDTWLEAARGSLLNLLAAAREGARRPRKRVLARAEIRRQAREAFAGASALLDEAAGALRVAHAGCGRDGGTSEDPPNPPGLVPGHVPPGPEPRYRPADLPSSWALAVLPPALPSRAREQADSGARCQGPLAQDGMKRPRWLPSPWDALLRRRNLLRAPVRSRAAVEPFARTPSPRLPRNRGLPRCPELRPRSRGRARLRRRLSPDFSFAEKWPTSRRRRLPLAPPRVRRRRRRGPRRSRP